MGDRLPGLSLRNRISLAFGVAFALTLLVGAFELSQLRAVYRVVLDAGERWMPRLEALAELKAAVMQQRDLVDLRMQEAAFPDLVQMATSLKASVETIDAASGRYVTAITQPEDRAVFMGFVLQWQSSRQLYTQALDHLEHGNLLAASQAFSAAGPAYRSAVAQIERLVAINDTVSRGELAAAERIYDRNFLLTLAIVALAAVGTATGAVWIGRHVSSPLHRISAAMRRLAAGDLDVAIDGCARRDEIGALSEAVAGYRDSLIRSRELGQQAEREQRLLQVAIKCLPLGFSIFDCNLQLIICNEVYAKMYSVLPELTKPGTSMRDIIICHAKAANRPDLDVDEHASHVLAEVRAIMQSEQGATKLWETATGQVVKVSHEPLPGIGFVAVHEDVTDRMRAEAQIVYLASHDSLTDLPNRAHFREKIEEALARSRRGESVAVLCLDLDRFKGVNDTLGHPMGDALLRRVADRLRHSVRETDTLARFGGDEFAVVQVGVDQPAGSSALAQRLIETLRADYEIDGHHLSIGASVGIALAPQDGSDAHELLKRADLALYRAKREGRGSFRLFAPEMDERALARHFLEKDLRRAFAQGEFILLYQPIVGLDGHKVSGFEALLRWRHPQRGLLLPAEFLPLTEEINLIVSVGEWALQTACRDAMAWPEGLGVSVNLSPAQFRKPGLVDAVDMALTQSGLLPARLELEVTERILLDEGEVHLATLQQLRDRGVSIAIDDFGTGYSSLSVLRRFPFNRIKIDRCFIRELAHADGDGLSFIQAIACLGAGLKIATTVEGVETQRQLDYARAEGCTEVQGYLFSPPVPASAVGLVLADIDDRRRTVNVPCRSFAFAHASG